MGFEKKIEKKIQSLKDDILGKKYSLSIAYVSPQVSRRLNKTYRKKDTPTNVLSFALQKNLGELVLSPSVIKKEARERGKTPESWLGFLVIHGMLHLKGFDHSAKMEKLEALYDQKYFHRYRHRIRDDESRRRRVRKRRTNS